MTDGGDGRRQWRRALVVVRATLTGVQASLVATLVAVVADRASAHAGSLGGATTTATVPTWLTVLTGGVVVGASFLFTTLLTDHEAMRAVNWWRAGLPDVGGHRAVRGVLGGVAVVGLALVVVTGFTGPSEPTRNFALLVVWAGWWAGYTMSTYLLGNTWPALNPWRALAGAGRRALDALGDGADTADIPDRYGVWPAVAGLLALVYLEVVSPIGERPTVLAAVVAGYSLVTVAGALRYGDVWFGRVDPVSRVFAAYGRVAPLQRDENGISLRLPGMALTDEPVPDRPGEAAFVVALLWVTTYDGLVATPTWERAVGPVVAVGVPALAVYALALVAGFGLFLWVYRVAARRMRERAESYVTAAEMERWFAPALLPIAAGYHVAHFLGYFLSLAPALGAVAASPLAPPAGTVALVLPDWFSTFRLGCVLAGHVLAVWVAHSLAFELFPGVLAAIRSQFPSVVVMIFYTMTSLWVITQPYAPPPFV
jgi:type IV secretory pathway TrbD component